MLLRGQNVDLQEQTNRHPFFSALDPQFRYDFPNGGDSLAPQAFVKDITAPVFIAGAWQDEQTGGRWADLLNRFAPTTKVRVVGQNGVHTESLDPSVLAEMIEFLDFYVAQKVPTIPPTVRAAAPAIWASITGVSGLTIPPDRFDPSMDFATALHQFESDPPVRINWEVGAAAGSVPGAPVPSAETRYPAWPIPDVAATSWYFLPGGGLGTRPASGRAACRPDRYRADPAARPRTSYTGSGGGIWTANPTYDWKPVVDGKSLSYLSRALPQTVSMAGTGSVDLWVKASSARRRRPGDAERGAPRRHRALRPERLAPPEPPQARPHPYHPARPVPHRPRSRRPSGSRGPLREGPGADLPVRLLVPGREPDPADDPGARRRPAAVDLRHDLRARGWQGRRSRTTERTRSRVVLPVLPVNPTLAAAPAPCPSLRAEPCRTYVAPAAATAHVTWS